MSSELQSGHSQRYVPEDEIWKLRWFLVRLNAIALLLSIPASVIIAILTKNPLPGLIPAPLIAPFILIIRWAFFHPREEKQHVPRVSRTGQKTRKDVIIS